MNVDELQKKSFTIPADELVNLISFMEQGVINQNTAKSVLAKMFIEGKSAEEIIEKESLRQISDHGFISQLVGDVLNAHPREVESFLSGKETLFNWLFGQVMRSANNKVNPQLLRAELEKQLDNIRKSKKKKQ
jgi:aspartyl-tRNA(Asn)/glutamyl-tRNA(Gln) amidotransferase subunit B